MKKTLLFVTLSLITASSFSQYNYKFGSISIEESNLKQVPFDPEASAVVLVDEGYSDYSDDNGLLTYYHKRIKILKEDGRDYADVRLWFNSENEFEILDNIEAVAINVENGLRKDLRVENKSIYYKKINKYRTEVSFAFPDVKVGSIIEYKYRVVAKHYGGLRNWTFQSDIPVLYSSYRLKIVPGHEVSYLVQYNPNYQVAVDQIRIDHAIKFEMKNIPALTDEPYMDAREDYIQKVIFQTTKYVGVVGQVNFMSTWKEVTKELYGRSDFGRQLKIQMDECKEFLAPALNGKSDLEKMQLIHHYVINNCTWDGIYSVTADEGIKNLWKKKTGSSGQINLLLVNLLKDAGLEAFPMLVSERGHGRVNKDQPFINQFNNVYAVVLVNNKQYYLDATDRFTPSQIVPYSILNTTAFIADYKAGGLVDIHEEEVKYQDMVTISSSLKENGELAGSVNLESKDYARAEKLGYYTNHKTDYIDNYIKKGMVNVNVDNFNIKNAEQDNLPLTQAFDFKTNIQSTGEYSFLSLNMFTGFESNPFIVNDRFSNINFGYKKSVVLNYVINLPANYKVDEIPKNIKLVNPDRSVTFTREIFQGANAQLMARIRVDINRSLFGVEEYPGIKDFFKQMVNLMNEQVVLKKM